MSFAELFIRRPVATVLVMLAILLFGAIGYRALPVSDLPNVDFPTILVSANLPGASPETMASSVATPLERQFSTIAGLDSMTSSNVQGSTQVTLQFNLSPNSAAAAQDVQAAITQPSAQLPQTIPSPPSFRKVNPADQPILYLALGSPTLPLSDVDEYAETFLAQRISMVSGVAQVQVFGSQKYAVRVQLDPRELASRQLGINEVENAVERGNVNLPTGTLWGSHQAVTVQANGQLTDAAAYRPLIVAYRNGSPVRLEELGRVINSVENDKIASWFNGTRAVVLAILRQPGTNTVEVVDNIKALFPNFRALLPPAVSLNILYDRSVSIRDSVRDVKFTLLLTITLVVMVIFLFLRNLSATVIPSLALPMSIVGTFAVMYLLGYSLDNLSLMALTLSVGFVVDDAIVMLENIVRHMEMGEGVLEAAFRGAKEVGFTIVSMTLSLAAVFIPVLFLGGILGRLLHEFAVTIGAAILVSGFVSLTLTPMLCSRFLRPPKEQKHGALFNAFERGHQALQHAYDVTLQVALRHRVATMAVSALMLVGTVYLFLQVPKGFLPNEDTGSVFIFTEAAEGISFDSMVEHQKQLLAIVAQNPYVQNVFASVGSGGRGAAGTVNTGIMFIRLKPISQRPPADHIAESLRPKLAVVPGIRAYLQILPPIRIGGNLTKALYQFTLQSPDTEELYRSATSFEQKLRQLPGLQDVNSDLQIKNPQVNVVIDRDKASTLGVSAQQVEDALYTSYGARQISTIYAPNNEYRVIMELQPQYQRDPAALSLLDILVIYIILGVLYESFIHPITILSGLPSAGFGALLTLKLFHAELNLYAFVGVILLVGIVKKNAIMMIDFAIEAQRAGHLSAAEAIYRGCLVRFRPIMMTTMAALMGTLPIALGFGAGASARRPLGYAVVGGLLLSQIVTLYLTPVFYIYMESFQQWVARVLGKGREPALATSPEAAIATPDAEGLPLQGAGTRAPHLASTPPSATRR